MKLLRYLTAALMTVSMVGCCCSRCVVTDPCDPCGTVTSHGCCSLSRFWSMPRSFGYNWNNACTCGGCQCGCGGGELMDYSNGETGGCAGSCAAPVMNSAPTSSGCNCSQSGAYSATPTSYGGSYYPPSTPGSVPSPAGTQQPIPDVPPSYTLPNAPVPPVNSTTDSTTLLIPPPSGQQPQMVSFEEFQRLPGNVISGPGSTAATAGSSPSPIQQVSAGPHSFAVPPSPTPTAIRAQRSAVSPTNQQAVWAPSRTN
jgi:hypothetical protein